MNDDNEKTELRLDETNELFFKISVHGAARSPTVIQLVCEGEDISYAFKGKFTNEPDIVRFIVPALKGTLKRGQVCEARVEVIVDDHYFVPVKFNAEFTEPVSVVAESFSQPRKVTIDTTRMTVKAQTVSKAAYPSLRAQYQSRK